MTQERFISLVRAEQEPLRRFLLALCCGDAALADDIAQDALVRAYVASGSILGLSKFSTWLFRIAYNCYVDHCRKAKPERTSVDDALELPAAESSDSAFRYQQLYRALDRLPEKENAAISLFYFEDRSIKEIAAILAIAFGLVLSRGSRKTVRL
jgi:RNA polymerase sigma-70 factor (ECF subfamily)